MTEQQIQYDTKILKKKLTIILASIIGINIFLFGPGFGGNYLKNYDSLLWLAPIGCILYGFMGAIFLTFIPFNRLSYRHKYLLATLFLSIIFNIGMLVIGLSLLFN